MNPQDARLRSLYEITARTELGIAEQDLRKHFYVD